MATNFHIWKHFMVCMSGQPGQYRYLYLLVVKVLVTRVKYFTVEYSSEFSSRLNELIVTIETM